MTNFFSGQIIKYFLVSLAVIINLSWADFCYSQYAVIMGRVIDKSDNKPVSFANVYFNNSLTGTTTDSTGHYLIKNLDAGVYIFITSSVGYESYRKTVRIERDDTLTINVLLAPSHEQLSEVVVKGKVDVRWKRQFRKFEYNFFGPGVTSKSCEILNPWYLNFYENPKTDSFTAESKVPLEIINHRLGYKIYFSLRQFRLYKGRLSIYYGDVRFEELPAKTSGELASREVNRYNTYKGSLRNFFRDLINNSLDKDGFLAYQVHQSISFLNFNYFSNRLDRELVPLDRISMIIPGRNPNIRYIVSDKPIEIIYKGRYSAKSPYPDMPFEVSRIILNKNRLELNTNGFVYDPTAITVTGNRSWERAADMLPFEYEPPEQSQPGTTANLNELYFHLLDSLTAEVSGKGKLWGQEDVCFSTDKPYYIAGDEIWYSARLADSFSRRREEGERILYIDLVTPEDSVIIHQTLPSVDGFSSGHIQLPEYLPEGCYLLRGYTDWMRNFSEAGYTGRTITIHSKTMNTGVGGWSNSGKDTVIMKFFPEGGSLVNSIEGVLAFRAMGGNGEGVMMNGSLIDERDREIEKIKTNALGIGEVSFKPRNGRKYYLKTDQVNLKQKDLLYPLPEAKASGYKITLIHRAENIFTVRIEATSDLKDHGAILITQSGGRIFYHEAFFLDGTEKNLTLFKSQLPEGVLQLNLFDLEGGFIGQRLIYNDHITERPEITIKTNKQKYNPNEQVALEINVENDDNIPLVAELSLSVTSNDLFDPSIFTSSVPEIMLESAFFEEIQNPDYYFRDTTEATRQELDNLLLTLTQYRYDWKRISSLPGRQYEKARMLRIYGRALDRKRVCSECQVNLFPVGDNISFLTFTTGQDGKFSTYVPGLFDSAGYIVQMVNKRGRVVDGKIIVDEHKPYKIGNTYRSCISQIEEENVENYNAILKSLLSEHDQMRTILLKEVPIAGKPVSNPVGLRKLSEAGLYGIPDEVINLNDNKQHYYSITDAIMKNVSGFVVSSDDPGHYNFVLHGPHSFNGEAQDPLFIVDGVELGKDAYDKLKTITPGQVEKIEVFKDASAAMWGSRGANGVFVIYTKQGESDSSRRRSVLNIKGFSPEMTFQPAGEDTKNSPIDKRITVYWADNLSTDSNGSIKVNFTNASNARFFTVHVEGITSDGVPFSYTERSDR